jgi:cysteinyl-tRNA synthetase
MKSSTLPAGSHLQLTEALTLAKQDFEAALDDDLNTAEALGALFTLIRECNNAMVAGTLHEDNRREILAWFDVVDDRLAIIPSSSVESEDKEIEALIAQRTEARRNRDFAESDRIRQKLLDAGVIVEDTREGMKWRRK